MSRTIQCIQCGVVLSLPDQAGGRKLKCPKCGTKFRAGESGPPAVPGDGKPRPASNADSTFDLPKNSSGELPVMPAAGGDLRETFDLPMMTGSADGPAGGKRPGSSGAHAATTSGGRHTADALALFDDRPTAPRRKTGAEARALARRCPTCGGVIPQGMSLCQTCGLDLETGSRVMLDDELVPPPPPRASTPLPIAIVGSVCCGLSAILGVLALIQWQQGKAGFQYFVPIAAFGVYAAVQFLRGRSVKLLLAALTLGALIDLGAFIALPIIQAQTETVVQQVDPGEDQPDAASELIRPVTEQLDTNRLTLGIALLSFYAIVSIYLLSPPVQRHFRK
jgi:hypothetical protein